MFIVSSFTWTYCGKIWFSMTYHVDFGRLTLLKDWVRVLHKRNKHKSIFFVLEHHGLSLFFFCFDDIGSHHIETSPLICRANQRTGFYLIETSAMKEFSRKYLNEFVLQKYQPLFFQKRSIVDFWQGSFYITLPS